MQVDAAIYGTEYLGNPKLARLRTCGSEPVEIVVHHHGDHPDFDQGFPSLSAFARQTLSHAYASLWLVNAVYV